MSIRMQHGRGKTAMHEARAEAAERRLGEPDGPDTAEFFRGTLQRLEDLGGIVRARAEGGAGPGL